ncbi:MAG: heavy-metal-associated domain-containing protein [Flavobacteriales bacterium]
MRPSSESGQEELILKIDGMNCSACSDRIQKLLKESDGVVESRVDHQEGRGIVAYEPNRVDPQSIVQKIEGVGFGTERIG